MVLTMTPSPGMLRSTARNRVGNQLARTPGGESAATALAAPQTRFTRFAPHAANRSPTPGPPGEPPHGLRSDDGVAGAERLVAPRHATRVKRLGSGPIGGGGDSPVTHRAPGYQHDCAQSRGLNQPPPLSSVRARTSRFSAATTRSDVPATPLSLRLGAPVSQRYRDVEDALARPSFAWPA